MKIDSENILQLLNKYKAGNTSSAEEEKLVDYLQNNPGIISDEGYNALADKLVYEHSLLVRKANFASMLNNPPHKYVKLYIVAATVIVGIVGLVILVLYHISFSNLETEAFENESIQDTGTIFIPQSTKTIITDEPEQVEESAPIVSAPDTIEPASEQENVKTEAEQKTPKDSVVETEEPEQVKEVVEVIPVATVEITDDEAVDTCPDYTKDMKLTVEKSEVLQDNGSIIIETKHTDLEFSLDKEFYSNFNEFDNLQPNTYALYIKDADNCTSIVNEIVVSETACVSNYKRDLAEGETWQIQLPEQQPKSLTIYNTKGFVVYKQLHDFTTEFYWEGTTQQGDELPEGIYTVVLLSKNETCVYNVTILR